MNINELLSVAKKNQLKAVNHKKIGYSTEITPAKKLERTVNPDAIKAFISRKKEIEKIQDQENVKKKQQLLKLREDQKNTKKARAMATRTKDNLKIFHNAYNNRKSSTHDRDDKVVLSPEAEMRHKAFMNKIMSSNQDKCSANSQSKEEFAENKHSSKKQKKYQQKVKVGAQLDFKGLLNLAQQHTDKASETSSDEEDLTDDDSSSENDSAKAKYEKERRKRKELEAQLKAMKRQMDSSTRESSYKVPRLEVGLSEESKNARVKSLMEKFKQRSQAITDYKEPNDKQKKFTSNNLKESTSRNNPLANGARRKDVKTSHSLPRIESNCKPKNSVKLNPKSTESYMKSLSNSFQNKNNLSNKNNINKVIDHRKSGSTKTHVNTKLKEKSLLKQNIKSSNSSLPDKPAKKSNPYAELMRKAKTNANQGCTLSVTSSAVRTNYPEAVETRPPRPIYEKIKIPTKAMIEAYKRKRQHERQGSSRRPIRVLHDDDSEDDYDSEMEGFIDDDVDMDDDQHIISSEIGKIFGYDKSKYGRESEYELSKMDASYKDIEKEEKRSLKIAKKEDAIEAKRLMEEEERRRKRRMK